MKLIGMLDSPYVRRVAVSLECLGIAFEHDAKSVFTTYDEFKHINPVVKAPTLVCDDGEVLMDSSLILQFIEMSAANGKSLWPKTPKELQHDFRAVSLALAACDKGVQLIYECNLRPESARYEPWLSRVKEQINAALEGLENEIEKRADAFANLTQASIAAAITWQFMEAQVGQVMKLGDHPNLSLLSKNMEQLPQLQKYQPVGPGVQTGGK